MKIKQADELTNECLYLRKCNDILEEEKRKHLEYNALERDELCHKFTVIEKLRSADKQLIENLTSDL